jgi:hypothetical protein
MADPFNFTNNSSPDPMSPNFTGAVKGKGRFANPFTTDLTEATKAWQASQVGMPDNVIRPGLGAWNLGIVPEDLYRAAGLKGSTGAYTGANGRWDPTNATGADDTLDQKDQRMKILMDAGLDQTEAFREADRGYDMLQSRYVTDKTGTTQWNEDGTQSHINADGSVSHMQKDGSPIGTSQYQGYLPSLDPNFTRGMGRGGAQGTYGSGQASWTPAQQQQQTQWQQQSGMQNPYMPQQNTAQTAQPYQYQQPNQWQQPSNPYQSQQPSGLLGVQNNYGQQQTGLLSGGADQFKNKFADPMGMVNKFKGV